MEPFGSELNPDLTRRNIYGVLPCPKCKSVYRYPTQPVHQNCILCDECQYIETIEAVLGPPTRTAGVNPAARSLVGRS